MFVAPVSTLAVEALQTESSQQQTVTSNKQAEMQLRQMLRQYNGFSADFKQTVLDSEFKPLHEALGHLQFRQPGQFRWQVAEPEPELLLSNGQTLWWFNPFVEQVSIFDAEDAVATTPFALLVSQDDAVWSQFAIEKRDSGFDIRPKQTDSQVILLHLEFKQDVLAKIEVTSRSHRLSRYELQAQSFSLPTDASFDFEIPAGTDIDDQRKSASELVTDGKVQF